VHKTIEDGAKGLIRGASPYPLIGRNNGSRGTSPAAAGEHRADFFTIQNREEIEQA
jgi:hypothetical protein